MILPTNSTPTTRANDPILGHSARHNAEDALINAHEAKLASLAPVASSGDYNDLINKPAGGGAVASVAGKTGVVTLVEGDIANLTTDLAAKQVALVSGTNIKTINGVSLLGSGDIVISGGSGSSTLAGDTDVAIASPADKDVLTYSASAGKWQNQPAGTTTVPDATTSTKGIIELAGDLAGTAVSPTVPALANKANLAGATFTGAIAATNLSNTNTGDETTATIKSKLGITTLSGSNTGDQTISLTGDATGSGTGSFTVTVSKINGVALSGLATGILKNTTATGIPSIAVAADFPILNQSTTGTSSNVTGTVAIGNGGTGQTTKANAYNALTPIVALGDLVYGSGANVATNLAGNATTTKKFLTQTGTGAVSAAPAWASIVAADVPTLNQSTTGTASNITGTLAVGQGGTGATTTTGSGANVLATSPVLTTATVAADPATALGVASKQYVDAVAPSLGWIATNETWSAVVTGGNSSGANYITYTVSGDKTGKYSPGMRTWQGTAYGIITSVSFSSPNTTVIAFTGNAPAAPAGGVHYSMLKVPFGFPLRVDYWTVKIVDFGTLRSQASAAANTWYNAGGIGGVIPLGTWDLGFEGSFQVNNSGVVMSALSTSTSTNTDSELTAYAEGNNVQNVGAPMSRRKTITLTGNTTYFILIMAVQAGLPTLYIRSDMVATVIRAICGYL